MSTRSTIAIRNDDGTYRHIYCHYDGYLEGVGLTLLENYTTKEQVNELLDLGDCCSLGKSLDDSEFYGRDRYDGVVADVRVVDGYDDLLDECHNYCYIFVDGEWTVNYAGAGERLSLADELRKEMEE